jgi:hypothetical protein
MSIFLTGLAGVVLSTQALFEQETADLNNLVHGSQVKTWRLQPMREAGLLQLTEVPLAWHDEGPQFDGSRSCALTKAGVAILTDVTLTLPFLSITVDPVVRDDGGVIVHLSGEAGSGVCTFGPQEGGGRFVRQIQTEQAR